jgi:hypothetical protein
MDQSIAIVVLDSQTKTGRVDTPVSPDKQRTKDGLRQEIQDTVEHSLRVRRDDIATFANTPSNRVQDPYRPHISIHPERLEWIHLQRNAVSDPHIINARPISLPYACAWILASHTN